MIYYVISDTHFGSNVKGESSRKKMFHKFVQKLISEKKEITLIIAGDFFDFWVEYSNLIRKDCIEPIADLRELSNSGLKVIYVRGNHDFMSMDWFSEFTKATIVDELIINSANKKIWITHGDHIFDNPKKKLVFNILRNRFTQKIYTFFSIRGSLNLAQKVSNLSRVKKCKKHSSDFIDIATQKCKSKNCDIVITGHTHKANIETRNSILYANSGYWIKEYTYLIIEDGEILLNNL